MMQTGPPTSSRRARKSRSRTLPVLMVSCGCRSRRTSTARSSISTACILGKRAYSGSVRAPTPGPTSTTRRPSSPTAGPGASRPGPPLTATKASTMSAMVLASFRKFCPRDCLGANSPEGSLGGVGSSRAALLAFALSTDPLRVLERCDREFRWEEEELRLPDEPRLPGDPPAAFCFSALRKRWFAVASRAMDDEPRSLARGGAAATGGPRPQEGTTLRGAGATLHPLIVGLDDHVAAPWMVATTTTPMAASRTHSAQGRRPGTNNDDGPVSIVNAGS
mmetsp:Transcript_111800/g.194045  ORF Transcript_111800/g.194045 Transcript_111800/m.194045 type:complete len:278 (+) Transcript_111800:518-1351(+)